MPRKERKQVEPEIMSEVELLRLERTNYSRDEFVVHCGFGRGSYYRWIKGETEGKVTLKQLKQMAKILKIKEVADLPDDFCSLPADCSVFATETDRSPS